MCRMFEKSPIIAKMDQPLEGFSVNEVWIKAEPIDDGESTETFYINNEVVNNTSGSEEPSAATSSVEVTIKSETTIDDYEIMPSESNPLQLTSSQLTSNENRKACDECGMKDPHTHHLTVIRRKRLSLDVSCGECGKSFSQKSQLKRHMLSHSGIKAFACDECGMRFSQKAHVKPHKQSHTLEKPFTCDECGSKFKYKNVLKKHTKIHSNDGTLKKPKPVEKKFGCDECGAKFGYKIHLTEHQRMHTGERPFVCDECEKKFSKSSKLSRHKRCHTGEKPFACDDCGMRFSQKCYVKTHKLTHSGEKPFACDECGMRFRHRTLLKKHVNQHIAEHAIELQLRGRKLLNPKSSADCTSN